MKQNLKSPMNNRSPFKSKILTLAALSTLAACGSHKNDQPSEADRKKMDLKSGISLNGEIIGSIDRKVLPQEAVKSARNKLQANGLLPINTNRELNVSAYRVRGLSEDDRYYVAPRLYVYSNSDFGKLSPDKNGLYNVTFNIAIIDGLSKTEKTLRADGTTLDIPESLRASDYEKVKEEIRVNEGVKFPFAVSALPGCPSKISVNIAGQVQDVTPPDIENADYCELNQPFAINVKMDEKKLDDFMNDQLVNHKVDVNVMYSMITPVPVSELHASFNKRKLFYALKAKLALNDPPYAQIDIQKTVESTLQSMDMSVYIVGDYNSQMKFIVDKAIEAFFTKMIPNPNVALEQKCASTVCLEINEASLNDEENFNVNWSQTSNQRLEKAIYFGSKLGRTDNETIQIGSDQTSKTLGASPLFSNVNSRTAVNPLNQIATGLLPTKGSRILVVPTSLVYEERRLAQQFEILPASSERICTGSTGFPFNECTYTDFAIRKYTSEKTGNDIWTKIAHSIQEPLLWNGLKVNFKLSDGKNLECLLTDLSTGVEKGGLILTIKDSPNCLIFEGYNRSIVQMSLINEAKMDPIEYISGTYTLRTYTGTNIVDDRKSVKYNPEVRAVLQLTLLGTGFKTESMHR